HYLIVEDEEFEAVQVESTRTIEIDQFVPRNEIDDRYIDSPYYLAPDGQVGQDAFAVIRDTIAKMNMVALGRVVLSRREHVIALEARGLGLLGLTLRYPYEVLRGHPRTKAAQGYARSCKSHRQNQNRPLRSVSFRGSIRKRID